MSTSNIIRKTAYIVGTAWSLVLAVNGLQLDKTWAKALSFLPLFLVALFLFWDKYLWRRHPFISIAQIPDLNGTWLGSIDAEWFDNDEARRTKRLPAALIVRQTFTKLSITLVTAESKSYSVLSSTTVQDSGEFRINYEYTNTPLLKYRQRMPVHDGSTWLSVAKSRPVEVSGEYWTNRMSRGMLEFTWRSSQRVTTLAAAEKLAQDSSRGVV